MSDDLKARYQSRTVWGALIAIAASLANAAGVEVTSGDGYGGGPRGAARANFGAPARAVRGAKVRARIHLPFSVDRLLLASE